MICYRSHKTPPVNWITQFFDRVESPPFGPIGPLRLTDAVSLLHPYNDSVFSMALNNHPVNPAVAVRKLGRVVTRIIVAFIKPGHHVRNFVEKNPSLVDEEIKHPALCEEISIPVQHSFFTKRLLLHQCELFLIFFTRQRTLQIFKRSVLLRLDRFPNSFLENDQRFNVSRI